MIEERTVKTFNGILVFLVLFTGILLASWGLVTGIKAENPAAIVPFMLLILALGFLGAGLFMVQPNQARALTLFGKYVGSTRVSGLRWANPLYMKKSISLRVRNFESGTLKVNDLGGSPIEIATVVVWQVVDSAEALFAIDDYTNFVHVQTEAALRQMATSYPYDGESHEESEITLRGNSNEVSEHLKKELQERLANAGVDVLEARISHLAYAPEIAGAMLQRQQAGAIIAARSRIVEGAVTMVEMALKQLKNDGIIDLDEERRAAMVSNLMVVLCSDKNAQPIVNAGSLY